MRRADPIPVPELAVPVEVAWWLASFAGGASCARHNAIGDLGIIAFFFLLRVGEYTSSRSRGTTRTKQFRVRNVSFTKDGEILDPRAPLHRLYEATGGTLKLSNQKNGIRGSCVHHHAVAAAERCPIKALARRVHHILAHGGTGDSMLCEFHDHTGTNVVLDQEVTRTVKLAVVDLKLPARGFPAERVGLHSLRAGGAVAMAVNGESRDMIKKIGRWSSDTFLMYIHEQIAHLTAGVSERMSKAFPFFNIEGASSSA